MNRKIAKTDGRTKGSMFGQLCITRGDTISECLGKIEGDHRGRKLHVAHFESIRKYVEQAERVCPADSQGMLEFLYGREEWTHGKGITPEQTIEGLRRGLAPSEAAREEFRNQRQAMKGIMSEAKAQVVMKSNRRKRVHQWGGGSINMNRYMVAKRTGKPTPVYRTMTRRCDTPTIRLAYNYCLSHQNKLESFLQTVAMAGALAEALIAEGFGVTIDAISASVNDGPNRDWKCTTIRVKHLEEPVNPERLMSTAYPGLLRFYGFRMDESLFKYYNGNCLDVPVQAVKMLGYDSILGKSWNGHEQRQRLIGEVKAVIADPNAR